MTVRRVSRRSRRHLRRSAKGGRRQKGGAYSDADTDAWVSAVRKLYDETGREYRDSNNEFIIDKLKGLSQISDNVHISIDDKSILLKEVAARVAVFMYNFKNQEEHTYTSYMNWYTTLDSDDMTKIYKLELLKYENALRNLVKKDPITDIGISSDFPLYIWALLFKTESEEVLPPILVPDEQYDKRVTEIKTESEQADQR